MVINVCQYKEKKVEKFFYYWTLNKNWLNVRRETKNLYGILLLHPVNINIMASHEVSPKIWG